MRVWFHAGDRAPFDVDVAALPKVGETTWVRTDGTLYEHAYLILAVVSGDVVRVREVWGHEEHWVNPGVRPDRPDWYRRAEPPSDALVVIGSPEEALRGRILLLDGNTRVGRGTECDVVLTQGCVSRLHACIELDGESYWIADRGTVNGTRINDAPLTERRRLEDGDRIKIGSTIFTYLHGADVSARAEELRTHSLSIDGLTGASTLPRLLERAAKLSGAAAVVVFDLDFADQRGEFGDLAFDYVLAEAVRVLRRSHGDEVLGRWDTWAIAVLIEDTTPELARLLAEELRARIAAHAFTYEDASIPIAPRAVTVPVEPVNNLPRRVKRALEPEASVPVCVMLILEDGRQPLVVLDGTPHHEDVIRAEVDGVMMFLAVDRIDDGYSDIHLPVLPGRAPLREREVLLYVHAVPSPADPSTCLAAQSRR